MARLRDYLETLVFFTREGRQRNLDANNPDRCTISPPRSPEKGHDVDATYNFDANAGRNEPLGGWIRTTRVFALSGIEALDAPAACVTTGLKLNIEKTGDREYIFKMLSAQIRRRICTMCSTPRQTDARRSDSKALKNCRIYQRLHARHAWQHIGDGLGLDIRL